MRVELLLAALGIAGTIAGTVLGWFLNERSVRHREHQTEQRQITTARTLLEIEIDYNRSLLDELWGRMNAQLTQGPENERLYLKLAVQLATLPLPTWSHKAWDSQLPYATLALTSSEVRIIHKVYQHLETLNEIHQVVTQVAGEQATFTATGRSAGVLLGRAPGLITQYQRTAEEVFRLGNPLQPHQQPSL